VPLDDGDLVAPEVEAAAAAADDEALMEKVRPVAARPVVKAPKKEPDLRTRLKNMRRSIDRRLLWARLTIDRRNEIEAEQSLIAERSTGLDLHARIPDAPGEETIRAALREKADAAGIRLTSLVFEQSPPDLERLPSTYSGDKPIDLTWSDLIGTLRVSFVLLTEDEARLAGWYETLRSMQRFIIVNRLRHMNEEFHINADAYWAPSRVGPVRRENVTDIDAELERAGVLLPADEIRHQDPDHFLLAAEISLKELNRLLDDANGLAAVEAANRRGGIVIEWYEERFKARASRPFSRLLR